MGNESKKSPDTPKKTVNKAHKVEDPSVKSTTTPEDEIEFVGVDADASESTEASGSLEAELEKVKSEFLYLQAEYENHRRQAIKERSDLLKYGAEHLVRDLLNVVDIFDMALKTEVNAENFEQFQEGVIMTSKELLNCFERHGIRRIESQGKPFDPQMHEALSSEETNSMEPGYIYRVHKEAFKLHDRVIRPAQVVVAKEPSDSGSDAEDGK